MEDVQFVRIVEHNLDRAIEFKAHALKGRVEETRAGPRADTRCGRTITTGVGTGRTMEAHTRLRRDWEYCGNCSRIVTAVYDRH